MKRFMLVAILFALLLTGCSTYSTRDETQMYYKIRDNIGQRLNVSNNELCLLNPINEDEIFCFQTVYNPYLEGHWQIEDTDVEIWIYRDEATNHLMIADNEDAVSTLVFAQQNIFFMQGATETLIVRIEASHSEGSISLEDGTVFYMKRIVQGQST